MPRSIDAVRRRAHGLLMRAYAPVAQRAMRRRGAWRWRGLTLEVPVGVFHPGLFFSSTVLADEIRRRAPRGRQVLDVGCGSGLLALAAAQAGGVVTAVDVNPAAVTATRANAVRNGLTVEVVESDLFAALGDRRFDLVVVNPPYYRKDPADDAERAWFAGIDLGYFDGFFDGLGAHLAVGATVLMVLSEGCDLDAIGAAARLHGYVLTDAVRRYAWLGLHVVHEVHRVA